MTNPLIDNWETPYGTPPFHLIRTSYYKKAVEYAINQAREEIALVTENPASPDFDNTVAALDRAGDKLSLISSLLFNLNSAETSGELQKEVQEISPILTRFSNDITLNDRLFSRISAVYRNKGSVSMTTEEEMLLEKHYRNFILGGAGLGDREKKRFREISEELAQHTLKFEENVLAETKAFELLITDINDLKGIPSDKAEAAAEEAIQRGRDRGWLFTLDYPSYVPFMQYCDKRELREKMFKAYTSRAYRGNQNDNRTLVSGIANLRLEKAKLLGFSNYAEMVLGDKMAGKPATVSKFLDDIYNASRDAGLRDVESMKDFARNLGHKESLEPWDWAYYSEKLKKSKFNIDDELLKPYFSLSNVRRAVFDLAERLFGLKFVRNKGLPVYHSEVEAYLVYDDDGSFQAVLYLDFHPRKGKNNGAWMTNYREQKISGDINTRPVISVVTNFTRPSRSKPSLLTFNELTTFLHEFGHALHGMLSQCTFESLSGTNVARDFVELPSQILQNWAYEQEWLESWAVHYRTGKTIPFDLVKKIRESSTFNEGYACQRQLGFGFLDMAWHTVTGPIENTVSEFEISATQKTELLPPLSSSNLSCSFTHLFSGGYAAGYYGYKWAEVLDADAFQMFRESGIFNRLTAGSFRKNILEKGGSDNPLNLYIKFRGKKPDPNAFLKRRGLIL